MTATRQGPALTITGTCEGCRWLLTGVRDPALIGRHSACTHPTRNDGGTIFARSSKAPMMPEWCPLLPAARLALARGIVAEAEGTTVAALAADECPGKGRCHGAMKWCETCGPVAGTCDDTACDQHDAAHGAGEESE